MCYDPTIGDPYNDAGAESIDDFDPVAFFCEYGELERAASHIADGDIYRKATLGLDLIQAVELERFLAERGLAMFDDGDHWLFMRPDIAAGERRPPKRSDDAPEAPGPAPTSPLFEGQTKPQCTHGPHEVAGPPEPFCCEARRRQVLKIDAGERPAFTGGPMPDDADHDAAKKGGNQR